MEILNFKWTKTIILHLFSMVILFSACEYDVPEMDRPIKSDADDSVVVSVIDTLEPNIPMEHVGALHTPEDFARIRTKLDAEDEAVTTGWNMLINNSHAQLTRTANPVVKLVRGGGSREEPDPDNYGNAMRDVAAAYQLALRWKISGDDAYAETAITILNAWASTCEQISGDTNTALAGGIYGYQFAVVGELLRDYDGWEAQDFEAYKQWMLDVFYSLNMAFLTSHWGTCDSHYWANWDLANLASVMAIGILTDNRSIYNYAVDYLQNGNGNGNWYKAFNHVFDGENAGLAQIQESGRDQGHTVMVIGIAGHIAQMAWNQGDDFYGLDDNRFMKACEYVAKYNVAKLEVPFQEYTRKWAANCAQTEVHTQISSAGRGETRPVWAGPYYHYAKIKNETPQYIELGMKSVYPEGGGGNYSPNSGGYDQLGFGTLMYTLD